jgi:hypothetical protein
MDAGDLVAPDRRPNGRRESGYVVSMYQIRPFFIDYLTDVSPRGDVECI